MPALTPAARLRLWLVQTGQGRRGGRTGTARATCPASYLGSNSRLLRRLRPHRSRLAEPARRRRDRGRAVRDVLNADAEPPCARSRCGANGDVGVWQEDPGDLRNCARLLRGARERGCRV